MEFVKDGVLYNTETSTKIGRPIQHRDPDDFNEKVYGVYKTLYLSPQNKRYYLLFTRGRWLFSHPIDVEVLSNDKAFRWAAYYLSADAVKKHFSDTISEG